MGQFSLRTVRAQEPRLWCGQRKAGVDAAYLGGETMLLVEQADCDPILAGNALEYNFLVLFDLKSQLSERLGRGLGDRLLVGISAPPN